MKKTILTVLLYLPCCWLAAQCPAGGITFSTQGQIDSFQINYPGCTDMPGNVTISGNDITNLQGLSTLNSIGGCLKIYDNPKLTSLNGLETLSTVGSCVEGFLIKLSFGLLIQNNAVLASLDGLDHLQSVKACVTIEGNPSLTALNSLDSLVSVGICTRSGGIDTYQWLHSVAIIGNNSLKTIDGFENLDSLSILAISQNDSLSSLEGLGSLHTVSDRLDIEGNFLLPSLQGLNNLQSVGELYIGYNTTLPNFKGLDSLQSAGRLYIEFNDALQNFEGLEKLSKIYCHLNSIQEGWISLHVESNFSLIDFKGLENVQNIGCGDGGYSAIKILNNWSLQSLTGIGGMIDSLAELTIQYNPSLATCNIQPLCKYIENGYNATIADNASGCNSVAEVEAACMVSIEETPGGEPVLLLSPNPAGDFLKIQINDSEKWGISGYDVQGRQMFRQVVSGSQTIDVKDWPPGIYALRAVSGGRAYAGRFIKQ